MQPELLGRTGECALQRVGDAYKCSMVRLGSALTVDDEPSLLSA